MQFQCPWYGEGWDEIRIERTSSRTSELECWESARTICEQMEHDNPHHRLGVGTHMIAAVQKYWGLTADRPELPVWGEVAVYGHDIGKAFTKTFTDPKDQPTTVAHFRGHQCYGAYLVLLGCGLDDQAIKMATIIQYHMEHFFRDEKSMSKLHELLGPELTKILKFVEICDKAAH